VRFQNIEIVIINKGEPPSFEEELAQDVIEIITVFSARLYGGRSHKPKRLLGELTEFRRRVDYKTRLFGSRLVVAYRWFPSSKTCSCCGVIKQTLALSQRIFHCDDCGFEAPRDVNAALNLAALAASSAVTACGEPRSGVGRKPRVKRGAAKQEEKTVILDSA
jgi:hypothetical protein